MARLLEEMAAEIGMELAVRLKRVEHKAVSSLLEGLAEAEVEEVEEGLYQVTLRDPGTGRPFLLVILAYSPGWVSPVTYMGHGVLDEELLRSLYPRIVERLRSSSSSR